MSAFKYISCYAAILLTLGSCSDIFEPSIEDQKVSIVAPAEGVASQTYSVSFWWNPIEDATRYNLQIVSPDFNTVATLVLDTNVTSTKFSYILEPGTYQWRIRAENASSQTAYVTRSFTVTLSSLTNQPFTVSSPTDSVYTNKIIYFTWPKFPGATHYVLLVDTFPGNFTSPSTYKVNQTIEGLSYGVDFTNGGMFNWKVKAINATEQTLYSDTRTVIVYKTFPYRVTNLRTNASNTNRILYWDAPINRAVKEYRLYAYEIPSSPASTDTSSFTPVFFPSEKVTTTSYLFTTGVPGRKYAWRVVAVDKALNESLPSYYNVFTR